MSNEQVKSKYTQAVDLTSKLLGLFAILLCGAVLVSIINNNPLSWVLSFVVAGLLLTAALIAGCYNYFFIGAGR